MCQNSPVEIRNPCTIAEEDEPGVVRFERCLELPLGLLGGSTTVATGVITASVACAAIDMEKRQ